MTRTARPACHFGNSAFHALCVLKDDPQGTPATVAKHGPKATVASHITEGAGVDERGEVSVKFHESAWMSVQGLGVGGVRKGLPLGSACKGIMLVSHFYSDKSLQN